VGGRITPEELKAYLGVMRDGHVTELRMPGLRICMALHYKPVDMLQSPEPVAEETEDERMVRLQREHTEREALLFHSVEG